MMRGQNESISLPLPPGQVLVFDHVARKVYVADAQGMWIAPRSEQRHTRRSLRGPLTRLRKLMGWGRNER
jgi:hypothetical protein